MNTDGVFAHQVDGAAARAERLARDTACRAFRVGVDQKRTTKEASRKMVPISEFVATALAVADSRKQ
jgi:hypothetical protein